MGKTGRYLVLLPGATTLRESLVKTLMRKSHVFRNLCGDLANLMKPSNFWDGGGHRLQSLHALLFEFL